MKLEILLVIIIGALIYDTYYGGVFLKYFNLCKKYYKLAGIIFIIFSIYLTLKKDPAYLYKMWFSKNALGTSHNMIRTPIINLHNPNTSHNVEQKYEPSSNTIHKGRTMKRSVSETKKKFVAYNQHWKCGHCGNTLNAWFEVDHIVRLDQGGTNETSNLVALCRECHGCKTATENM